MSNIHETRRWLPGTDGTLNANRAAAYVARWAHVFGVEDVYVVNAQPLGRDRTHTPSRNELLLDTRQHAARATAVVRKMLDDAEVTYRVHVELGDPAAVIIAAAKSENVSEIVLGSRGLGALARLVLGSIAYKVVHLANVPITLVGSPRDGAQSTGAEHRSIGAEP